MKIVITHMHDLDCRIFTCAGQESESEIGIRPRPGLGHFTASCRSNIKARTWRVGLATFALVSFETSFTQPILIKPVDYINIMAEFTQDTSGEHELISTSLELEELDPKLYAGAPKLCN